MIERLTQDQQSRLPIFAQKWTEIGLCCDSANQKLAEAGIKKAYQGARLDPPQIIVWTESPIQCLMAWQILAQVGAQIGDKVEDQVWAQVGTQVKNQVGDEVWAQVRAQAASPVGAQVGDEVWDQVWDKVWNQAKNQVGDQVVGQVWTQVWNQVGGQVWTQVKNQVWDQVGDEVWDKVGTQVWNQVGGRVRAQIWSQVENQVWDQVRDQVASPVGTQVRDQIAFQVEAQVRDYVWARVEDRVGTQVWAQVGDEVWDQVKDQVWNQAKNQVWNQVGGKVRAQVWAQVKDQVGSQAGDRPRDQISNFCFGQHDANWLGFYECLCDFGVGGVKALEGLWDLAKSAGWFLPYRNICFISERHNRLNFDDRNRLHADGKLACEYPDGWGVYAWHGTRMPEKYGSVHSSKWDPRWLVEEENAEIRRCLFEGIGAERLARVSHLISKWREYDLLQLDPSLTERHPDVRILKMMCPSTRKEHFLRVRPDLDDARTAATWVNHGIDPELFSEER